ncbi:hypothetical protein DL771_012351 [Monosporascus sp. 5C6A]|nr:hypothetical protein DL771_012351 [Monosporascus sp. 5C6A]
MAVVGLASTVPYFPSDQQEQSFWETIPKSPPDATRVPQGFSKKLSSPLAWKADDIAHRLSAYEVQLEAGDVVAVESALGAFKGYSEISTDTFPLPKQLAQRLKNVSRECYGGVGFSVVCGLDPSKYTAADNVALFAGIAAHVAPGRGFVDRKRESARCRPPPQCCIREDTGFHDGESYNAEIMGLYVLESGDEGGKLALSSSFSLYNELARTRPDVVETLAAPWVLDTFKDYNKYPPLRVPFLHQSGSDKVIFRFSRYPMTGFQGLVRNPALPIPTKAQVEAMDAVQFMAAANSIRVPTGSGDIVFINDQAVMHARDSFRDGTGSKRHVLKMFLRDPNQSWPVTGPALEQRQKIYGPNRDDGARAEQWWTDFEMGQEEEAPTNG